MRHALLLCSWKNERVFVNLNDSIRPGTHWVGYKKRDNTMRYIGSYSILRLAAEPTRYFVSGTDVPYNYAYERKQPPNTVICSPVRLFKIIIGKQTVEIVSSLPAACCCHVSPANEVRNLRTTPEKKERESCVLCVLSLLRHAGISHLLQQQTVLI